MTLICHQTIDQFRSCLYTPSKIFERVIYNQLYDHFIKNNLLSEQQYGFRANHSTELAAMRLVDHINHEMDKNHTPFNIYIDYPKLLTPWTLKYYCLNSGFMALRILLLN